MSRNLPWLRLYTETLTDEKLDYIADDTGFEKMYVMGIWSSVLMIAGKSNERGRLMSGDNPLTIKRISRTLQTDPEKVEILFNHFEDHGMIEQENETWQVTNWETRNPKSDSNAEKQKRYRERKKSEKEIENGPVTPVDGNESEPLRNGYSLEGDKEEDKEKEGEDNAHARAETTLTPPDEDFGIGLKFNKGVVQLTFGSNINTIWPMAKALQQHCDVPGWPKFEDNLYELFGMDDEMPTPADIERICLEKRKPNDDYWPSNFIRHYRQSLVQKPRDTSMSMIFNWFDRKSKFSDLPESIKAGIRATGAESRKKLLKNDYQRQQLAQEILNYEPVPA